MNDAWVGRLFCGRALLRELARGQGSNFVSSEKGTEVIKRGKAG